MISIQCNARNGNNYTQKMDTASDTGVAIEGQIGARAPIGTYPVTRNSVKNAPKHAIFT